MTRRYNGLHKTLKTIMHGVALVVNVKCGNDTQRAWMCNSCCKCITQVETFHSTKLQPHSVHKVHR